MIRCVRAPLRVSLFGGGTDYPAYFRRMPSAVLGFTINKYIYISALPLGAYVDYDYRISYSRIERVRKVEEIEHPVVRAALQHYKFMNPMDYSIQADMPSHSGLGSSSAFTVAFVRLISELQKIPRSRLEIAKEAVHIEHVLLKENVGVQDQFHAAFGGFNRFDFVGDMSTIAPIGISGDDVRMLSRSLLLVFTGQKRHASAVLTEQIANTEKKKNDADLAELYRMVGIATDVIESKKGAELVKELARMLHEAWQVKKRLSSSISNSGIDDLYATCLSHGALGGKLCGAGAGGFLLMVVPEEKRASFIDKLGRDNCVEFDIDMEGVRVI
jgi:D-glycero-alpha-D-manno-heptose-7-phosphate kinase